MVAVGGVVIVVVVVIVVDVGVIVGAIQHI